MPEELPEGLAITAISKRNSPADSILINKKVVDKKQLLNLPKNARVACVSQMQAFQMLDFRPDVSVEVIDKNHCVNRLENGDFDALVLDGFSIAFSGEDVSKYEFVTLNPKEFVPPSGQGFLCCVVNAKNKEIRKLLQSIHHKPSVSVSNVERTFKKLFIGDPTTEVGAYCEVDANGYYHVWAAKIDPTTSSLQYAKLSSSTSDQLAKNLQVQLGE